MGREDRGKVAATAEVAAGDVLVDLARVLDAEIV